MDPSRRKMMMQALGSGLILSTGVAVIGCQTRRSTSTTAYRPGTPWPQGSAPPRHTGYTTRSAPAATVSNLPNLGVPIQPRARWTPTGPVAGRVNPMNGVTRITIHHEGSRPVWFTDSRPTVDRLNTVRDTHVNNRGWGDVGYHFIIDRSGTVWEGRSVAYQGAHVSGENEHNLGIMVLGNFEQQQPSQAQLTTLSRLMQGASRTYRVPRSRVYTHRELNSTACPGRYLQPSISAIRTRYI